MSTLFLGIPYIAESQNDKASTANDAFDRLDAAQNAEVAIALADADITLTQAQVASGGVLQFTGTLTADRYINLPANNRAFTVRNSATGGNLIVQVIGAAGKSVSVAPGALVPVYCDAADVLALGGGGGSTGGGGGGTGGTGSLTAYDVTPTGTIDGTNAAFTLPNAPNPPASLQLFKNGRKMYSAIDFNLSGVTITYLTASIPQTNDVHIAGSYTY